MIQGIKAPEKIALLVIEEIVVLPLDAFAKRQKIVQIVVFVQLRGHLIRANRMHKLNPEASQRGAASVAVAHPG